jgi:uncharacterized membrane protein
MALVRIIKHLLTTGRQVKRRFPPACLASIKAAIGKAEASHRGEIRFAIEAALQPGQVIRGMTPRDRALDVFSELRVWDTQHNSGVLIYVLLADRAIEIIADRGIHARAGNQAWERIAGIIQDAFAAGRFEAGAVNGVAAVADELARHFPATAVNPDELPNDVKLL